MHKMRKPNFLGLRVLQSYESERMCSYTFQVILMYLSKLELQNFRTETLDQEGSPARLEVLRWWIEGCELRRVDSIVYKRTTWAPQSNISHICRIPCFRMKGENYLLKGFTSSIPDVGYLKSLDVHIECTYFKTECLDLVFISWGCHNQVP